jgi:tetratricopeptide (TPR) repeat protein
LTQQAEPHLRGKGQRVWMDRLDLELDNIRLALEWARSNDIEKGLQAATALAWFWDIRNHCMEGIGWLEQLLAEEAAVAAEAVPGNPPRSPARLIIQGKALNALGTIKVNWVGDENVVPLLEEARAIFEEHGDLAPRELALSLGNLASMEKDLDRSITGIMHALDLLRKAGDTYLIADHLWALGYMNFARGDFAQARANAEECLARYREAEDFSGEGATLKLLGKLDLISGNPHQAAAMFGEAQSCFNVPGNRFYAVDSMSEQAIVAMSEGNYSQAIQLSEAVLAWGIKMNEKSMMLEAINWLGWEAWALKDYDQATRQCEKSLALAREVQPTPFIDMARIFAQYILGRVALSQGEYPRAYVYLKNLLLSLEGKNETFWVLGAPNFGPKGNAYLAINALGVLASAQRQARRAATLFGAQAELYEWQKNLLSLAERDEYEQALASTRAALGEKAYKAAWEEGRRMTLDQAVGYATALTEN